MVIQFFFIFICTINTSVTTLDHNIVRKLTKVYAHDANHLTVVKQLNRTESEEGLLAVDRFVYTYYHIFIATAVRLSFTRLCIFTSNIFKPSFMQHVYSGVYAYMFSRRLLFAISEKYTLWLSLLLNFPDRHTYSKLFFIIFLEINNILFLIFSFLKTNIPFNWIFI